MAKWKVGLIGNGGICKGAHLSTYLNDERLEVVAVCDIIEERAIELRDKYFPDAAVYTDYKELLKDESIDAVDICTPNYLHSIIAVDAFKAGKHVLCEKPITVNYKLSCEMAEEAERRGKILNIGVCNRYHRSVELLKQYNDEGKFGGIYHIYCSFRSFRSIPGLGGPFTIKEQSGGGVLIDWGIHFLDLVLYVLGGAHLKTATCDAYCEMAKDMKSYRYKSMWAENTKNLESGINDVDDCMSGYVRTDKASISFNGAWAQNLDKDEMFVDFLGDKKGARLTYGGQFEVTDGQTLETTKTEHEIPNMYLREDEDFFNSIESGIKNKNNIDNILESMKLLDYLYRSAEIGKEIQF